MKNMELQNRIIGIAGRKGSGKSTAARRVLECCPRLFVFDAMGEHTWIPNRLRSLEAADDFLAWSETQENFAGAVIPDSLDDDFAEVAEMVYDRGNLLFAVEEIAVLCSPSFLPPELDRIVRLGRHRRLSLLWTAQRMVETSRRLTSACDWFVLFRHSEPRDLDGIAERCGHQVAGRVAELSLHGYLVWDVVNAREATLHNLIADLKSHEERPALTMR